jgi:UDP-glucose 4-epimerase
MLFKNYFLVGGAGFVGSHFVDALLKLSTTKKVTIYDNFSSGKNWHIAHHHDDARLHIVQNDVKNMDALLKAMPDHDVVMHFASNPDIARAVTEPSIDFVEGFYLTHQVIEAMRITGVKRLIYTSGSGVYGDLPTLETHENHGPLLPISTYGASKLAGEAFISSYCHMFDLSACVFRFGNIVGPRQTHGVGLDFVKNLRKNPTHLKILGDGTQSKSYIHVDDVVRAVLHANEQLMQPFEIYNVATGDYITVREIANIVIDCLDLESPVKLQFTGGDRGWAGDVPIVRLNTDKIRSLGWVCQKNSAEAIRASVLSLMEIPA